MKNILILIISVLCIINTAYARFATKEDTNSNIEMYNVDYSINKDGTYTSTTEEQIELVKEQSRRFAAKYTLYYNADAEKLDILEAKTIFEGKEYPVDQKMIEDKPISNNLAGFDSTHQVSISFPKPEIGAKIYIKYKTHTHDVSIKNHFAIFKKIGRYGYWKDATINISSAIPLKIKITDPFDVLYKKSETVTTAHNDKKNHILFKAHIKLTKPFTNDTISEPSKSTLNPAKKTRIYIASFDNWEQVGNELAKDYAPILKQPLPAIFKEIADIASKEKTSVNQINKVTTLLNEKIQYVGDWRTRKGRLVANDLEKVASKQSGDCKDFATVTTAILNHMGYKANVALVHRGEGSIVDLDLMLPSISPYNHLILKTIDKNDKTYWIDPTNVVSMADGIFPDIAGKPSLVLEKDNSKLEQVTQINADHARSLVSHLIDHMDNATIGKLIINLYGENASNLTGLELSRSKQSIEDILYSYSLSNNIELGNRTGFKIPDLTSRIVSPISIELNYRKNNMSYSTNFGRAYSLKDHKYAIETITSIDIDDNIHDVYLDYPNVREYITTIANNKVKNTENLNTTITTPWLDVSRHAMIKDNDTIIHYTFKVHKPWITNEEIRSDEFKKLKNFIERDIKNALVVIGS